MLGSGSSKNFNIVAFNSAEYATVLKNSNSQSITVELQLSEFKGKKYLKGIAKNIYTGTLSKPKNNDVLYGEYVLQLSHTVDNEKYYNQFNKPALATIIINKRYNVKIKLDLSCFLYS